MRFRNRTQAGNTTIGARRPSPEGAIPLGLRKAAWPRRNFSELHNPIPSSRLSCNPTQNWPSDLFSGPESQAELRRSRACEVAATRKSVRAPLR